MKEITLIDTPAAPRAIGPYSQGVLTNGGLIFTAGQIPLHPETGEIVEGDVRVQTRRVLVNLREILEAGGSGLENVVKTTVYLKDLADFAAMNEAYAEFFQKHPPARSTVEVARLPRDARVEIDAVALVRSR
jgi:2-iminobutanoate/2-iminopropanoate deaminase